MVRLLCLIAYQLLQGEEQLRYNLIYSQEYKGVHNFTKSICLKLNIIERLMFKLTTTTQSSLWATTESRSLPRDSPSSHISLAFSSTMRRWLMADFFFFNQFICNCSVKIKWMVWLLCLMAYQLLQGEEQFRYNLTHNQENKGVHNFTKSIYPKVNIIEWLMFKLTNYNDTVQHVSHHVTGTSYAPTKNQTHK